MRRILLPQVGLDLRSRQLCLGVLCGTPHCRRVSANECPDRFRSPDRTLCADLISLGFLAFAIRKKTTIEENPVTKRFIGARVEALRADRERSQDDLVLLFGFKDRQTVLAIETGMRRVTAGR